MGKLTIQDIAAILIKKNGFQKREANQFVSAMFALIQERLETDQLVKVKGLGTFKIIDVEARESVSVRTGERVTISGHAKISFIPDATMKELVNKPFSQFDTVVLNDGVEFDDIQEEEANPTPAQPLMEVADEEVAEEPAPVEDAAPVEEVATVEEAAPVEEVPVTEEATEEPVVDERDEVQESDKEEESDDVDDSDEAEEADEAEGDERPWGRWILRGLGVLALMGLSALGGYYYATRQSSPAPVAIPDTVMVRDTVAVAPADSIYSSVPAAKNEPDEIPAKLQPAAEAAKVEPLIAPRKEEPLSSAKKEPVSSARKEPAQSSIDKYAQKDARVRLGAYRIVGLDREVKVQPGQTFYSICRANLGPDMECYVEVFNDLPQNPTIKAGQVIKIPKLELKKKPKR